MRIASIQLYTYRLPLIQPVAFRGAVLDHRSGAIVQVAADSGLAGYGDAAPLPGFSDESLDEVYAEATRVARSLTGCEIPPAMGVLCDRFERWLQAHNLSASLCFALQCAVLELQAREQSKPLAEYLCETPPLTVPVNGLLAGDERAICRQASVLHAAGYRTFKLKVGRGTPGADAAIVNTLCQLLGDGVRLRIDANRAWDWDEAMEFAGAVANCDIEYIEEPLRDPSRLVNFTARSGIPVALDETLTEVDELERWRGAKAAVLKPTLLGGFEFSMWLARRARETGMEPVVSSAFESGVGLVALANFAAAVQSPHVAAGLDTGRWFAADLLGESLDMTGGHIDLAQANRARDTLNLQTLLEPAS